MKLYTSVKMIFFFLYLDQNFYFGEDLKHNIFLITCFLRNANNLQEINLWTTHPTLTH